ncbi:PTB domain-containing engulfment adapter protein 1 [Nelusetta ayraudi]|uniref:PTB domain-containing engulfment adapter protein 1 n=1 Tax=Nelusetta ayraudi TaxID=303726 RepID=UPI003F6F9DA7
MSDSEEDREISFSVKFLGRFEVVRPDGLRVLEEAAESLKTPDEYSTEKAPKKSKVHLFLSLSGVDILESKTRFLLYTCPLPTISYSAVLPLTPKVFGFVARHPAANTYHCYLFQSKKFSHVLVSLIGDAFKASKTETELPGRRDLIVEALRHKNKMLQREVDNLKRRLGESNF